MGLLVLVYLGQVALTGTPPRSELAATEQRLREELASFTPPPGSHLLDSDALRTPLPEINWGGGRAHRVAHYIVVYPTVEPGMPRPIVPRAQIVREHYEQQFARQGWRRLSELPGEHSEADPDAPWVQRYCRDGTLATLEYGVSAPGQVELWLGRNPAGLLGEAMLAMCLDLHVTSIPAHRSNS
jgi:hypothetical protein